MALTCSSAPPFSGGVDHDPHEGRHRDDPEMHLQHRPDGHGQPGLCPVGPASPLAGLVGALLGHLPDILVSAAGAFSLGENITEREGDPG